MNSRQDINETRMQPFLNIAFPALKLIESWKNFHFLPGIYIYIYILIMEIYIYILHVMGAPSIIFSACLPV